MNTKAFGIFEGGGAKGIAHSGALKAAEEKFVFEGVAGTSAGAIVAAFVAAGFKSRDLYAPVNPDAIFKGDLSESLFTKQDWKIARNFRDEFMSQEQGEAEVEEPQQERIPRWAKWLLFVLLLVGGFALCFLGQLLLGTILFVCGGLSLLWLFWKKVKFVSTLVTGWIWFHCCLIRYRKALFKISREGGVLGTEKFRDWMNGVLAKKLGKQQDTDVLFEDLGDIQLKIVAANSKTRSIEVFTKKDHPKMPIADAVCASISIPFVFEPKQIEDKTYVDGGIMSNFPAWVFDKEREEAPWRTPTIGFRLVEGLTVDDPQEASRKFQIKSHFGDVVAASLFGDNGLEKRNVSVLRELMLAVRLGVLDFDVSDEDKDAAHDAAYRIAKGKLENTAFRVSDENMGQLLKIIEPAIREEIAHPKPGHLRMSISLPMDETSLRIVYARNMDDVKDTDDRLAFKTHQGAMGRCWTEGSPVPCDLEDAKVSYENDWKMDKYQQRLVRETLQALLSYPIYHKAGTPDEQLVGILNIDSDDDILEKLETLANSDDGNLKSCADMLGKQLVEWRLT